MRKYIILGMLIGLFTSCNQTRNSISKKQSSEKPNVVLIFIDDQGYGDVGCYGATGFQTPNIDLLANEGMKFTNFYAAQPVCSVSRAGLLTGCYPNRLGMPGALFPKDTIGLNSEEFTMAEMFKEQGYATAIFGKWHLGWQKEFLPLQHGFDEYTGLPYSNDMWPHSIVTGERLPKDKDRGVPVLPIIEGNDVVDSVMSLNDQDKLTTLYTGKAVDFINRNSDNPFFLYVPHTMGHIPLGVSDKFRGKSEQGLYGDVMMEIDWSVGEISKALEKNNLVENTILIFTTDNGPWLNFGNHAGSAGGLREGKMTNWEGGQKVPFIIRWPGITPEGTVCNQLASAIDLLPTFASITNGRLSDNKIDGVDISSLLKGDFNSSPRETMLYYKSDGLNALRKGNWKLVLPHTWRSYDTEPGNDGNRGKRVTMTIARPELYDMMRDPGERYNVIDAYPEKAEEIMVDVEKARLELGDLNVGIKAGFGTRKMGRLDMR
jgi:arylsulfatase A-like enzyme